MHICLYKFVQLNPFCEKGHICTNDDKVTGLILYRKQAQEDDLQQGYQVPQPGICTFLQETDGGDAPSEETT